MKLSLIATALTAAVASAETVRLGTVEKLSCSQIASIEKHIDAEFLGKPDYYKAVVEEPAAFDADPYAIVHLLHSKDYGATTVRVNLEGTEVTTVENNYTVGDNEILDFTVKGQCPDETVEAVFGCCNDCMGNPQAVSAYRTAKAAMQGAGVKLVMLEGSAASPQAYFNWFACKNVKYWNNVGHGTPQKIILSGGSISANQFKQELGNDGLMCKLFFMCSCLTHNNPMLGAISGANPSHYVAGVNEIQMGTGDKVFGCFWEKLMANPGSRSVRDVAVECVNQHYGRRWPADYGLTEMGTDVFSCQGPKPTPPGPTPPGPTPPGPNPSPPRPSPPSPGGCGGCSNCYYAPGKACFQGWTSSQCQMAGFKWCGN